MSLLPFLLDDFGYSRPRYHHHHFYPSQRPHYMLPSSTSYLSELNSFPLSLTRDYNKPWRQLAVAARDAGSRIKVDSEKIQIDIDVLHFTPEEISVKIVDGYIIVEGKHEEKREEHGFVSRQFKRRYALPEGTAAETVESKLSSDGVLSITAPRKVPEAIKGERIVPITQTGAVRKQVKDQSEGTSDSTEINEKAEK